MISAYLLKTMKRTELWGDEVGFCKISPRNVRGTAVESANELALLEGGGRCGGHSAVWGQKTSTGSNEYGGTGTKKWRSSDSEAGCI